MMSRFAFVACSAPLPWVSPALKRAFALQPAVEDRSVQVVIETTTLDRRNGFWRLVSGVRKGVSCRSRSVKRTSRVDSQKPIPMIHKYVAPDLITPLVVTAISQAPRGRSGEIGGGRERPPFRGPSSGAGRSRFSHAPPRPPRGRSRPIYAIVLLSL